MRFVQGAGYMHSMQSHKFGKLKREANAYAEYVYGFVSVSAFFAMLYVAMIVASH